MEKTALTLISWNVNGLRALVQKDFLGSVRRLDADVVAVQETKLQESQLDPTIMNLPGYTSHWSHCDGKKGYSGVGAYSRIPPVAVRCGFGQPRFDSEGRVLELDFGGFLLLNVYFPNGGMSEERLQYKLDFYEAFFAYADASASAAEASSSAATTTPPTGRSTSPTARERNTSGFLKIERDWLDRILARGYVDTFRHFHPDTVAYSWWDYRFRARERNVGWRIDYFFVTRDLIDRGCVRRRSSPTTCTGRTTARSAWCSRSEETRVDRNRIVAIYGSPRRRGNTATLMQAAVAGAREPARRWTRSSCATSRCRPAWRSTAAGRTGSAASATISRRCANGSCPRRARCWPRPSSITPSAPTPRSSWTGSTRSG